MATEYARIRISVERDPHSTYLNPEHHDAQAALTPDEGFVNRRINAGALAGARTVSTAAVLDADTATLFMVTHDGAAGTAAITVEWTDTAANVCAAILVQGGAPLMTPDMDPTADFTLESADATTPPVRVTLLGT